MRPTTSPNRRSCSNRSAFSLIELLLVLVILAILAAVVVPKFSGRTEKAREAAARADVKSIDGALDRFELTTGRHPTTEEGLNALMEAPANVKGWEGPYLKRIPNDPWGNAYQYRYPGTYNKNDADVFSMGADGREGGGDDVDNWTAK